VVISKLLFYQLESVGPFSSDLYCSINKAFSATGLPHTGFLLFTPFYVNPRNGCEWKSQ